MKVFMDCLRLLLSGLMSADKHIFCQGRGCTTALASLLPVVDLARHAQHETVVMGLDISKAYDSICRVHMDRILDWVGIMDCYFYHLYCTARDEGMIYVAGPSALLTPLGLVVVFAKGVRLVRHSLLCCCPAWRVGFLNMHAQQGLGWVPWTGSMWL